MVEALLKGITLGLFLSIAVGPVLFTIIKHSINVGHRGALAFVAGVSLSDITLAFVSNVFSALFENLSSHKQIIGILGSIFLMAMGIYYIFLKKVSTNNNGRLHTVTFTAGDYVKMFLSGFFMNILNPAVFIFWLTTSTTFINHSIQERVVLFLTCLIIVLSADVAKVILANKIRNKLTPHNIHILNRINGFILVGFSLALIWGLLYYRIPQH